LDIATLDCLTDCLLRHHFYVQAGGSGVLIARCQCWDSEHIRISVHLPPPIGA
jgi:hypothetical protein